MANLPGGNIIPNNTALLSVPGLESDWFEYVFGAGQRDAHVKTWEHHRFRLTETGRAMMRRRVKTTYPGVELTAAHAMYAAANPGYHFDERYV